VKVKEFDAHKRFIEREGNFDIYRISDDTPLRDYVTEFSTSLATSTDSVIPTPDSDAKSNSGKGKKFSFDEECELASLMRDAELKLTKRGYTNQWTDMVLKVYYYDY